MSINIDTIHYRQRAEAAEAELAVIREQAPFIADALELYAHALEAGLIEYSPSHPEPEALRKAAAALPQEVE